MEDQRATIRPFAPTDYDAFAAVASASSPEYAPTAEQLRQQDAHTPPNVRWARLVAETPQGAVIGGAAVAEPDTDAGTFYMWLHVLPSHQGRGVGKQLYGRVLALLEGFAARKLRASARGDKARALRFLRERGFAEYDREHESKLDLATFAPDAWGGALRRAEGDGVVLATYAQLATDPERERKLHAMSWAIGHADQPGSAPPDDDFARFQRHLQNEARLLPDAFAIALLDGLYVGQSQLLLMPGTTELETGWTAVLPEHRQRGLATALKVATLVWAKAQGTYTAVRTWNNATNAKMIGINHRLGFVPQPEWYWFERTLEP